MIEIRKLKKKENIPIIIYSNNNLSGEATVLMESGATYYFQKPSTLNLSLKFYGKF